MHTVIIESVNQYNEIEWSERVNGGSRSGATRKANNWIANELFASDVDRIDRRDVELDGSGSLQIWTIR